MTETDASNDIAAHKAAECGRVGVSVYRLLDDLCDAPSYLFSEQRHADGLDPWTLIEGVDCKTDHSVYWVDVPGNKAVVMRPDDRVFVPRNHIKE